jgi:UDP-glucuronate 4-epimerase
VDTPGQIADKSGMSQRILVTGSAGFIGAALCSRLLAQGHEVLGVDNLNPYYDPHLKFARLQALGTPANFHQLEIDIADTGAFTSAYRDFRPQRVLHMAAQAGVRYSMENPHSYIESNVKGFLNVLEACRNYGTEHLVYASSSSVYGANTLMPYSVHHPTEHPISLYAATKKSNELMAHTYSHLYKIPTTGLRFFTVYGPWGRPDMAVFSFTRKILNGEPIQVFNNGHHRRDFTYIGDIADGVIKVLSRAPYENLVWSGNSPDPASSKSPYRLYNIGNHAPVLLSDFIATLENVIGRKAILEMKPIQPGDVPDTFADVSDLKRDFGFIPTTTLEDGLKRFYAWYKSYYPVPQTIAATSARATPPLHALLQ